MRTAGWIMLATGLWLTLVCLLRPRPRPRPTITHPSQRAHRSFPPFAPVSLREMSDGGPLTPAEQTVWRGIVAGLRDWQREAL